MTDSVAACRADLDELERLSRVIGQASEVVWAKLDRAFDHYITGLDTRLETCCELGKWQVHSFGAASVKFSVNCPKHVEAEDRPANYLVLEPALDETMRRMEQ